MSAHTTEPDPACMAGARGLRMRLDAHAGPEAEAYRAVVLRECATGRPFSDTVPWRSLTPVTLVALGVLVGMMAGLVLGAASVTHAPAHTLADTDTALPLRVDRTDVEVLAPCEDERPGAWTGAL